MAAPLLKLILLEESQVFSDLKAEPLRQREHVILPMPVACTSVQCVIMPYNISFPHLVIDKTYIQQVTQTKLLGLTISSKLTQNSHISNMIKRLTHDCSRSIK